VGWGGSRRCIGREQGIDSSVYGDASGWTVQIDFSSVIRQRLLRVTPEYFPIKQASSLKRSRVLLQNLRKARYEYISWRYIHLRPLVLVQLLFCRYYPPSNRNGHAHTVLNKPNTSSVFKSISQICQMLDVCRHNLVYIFKKFGEYNLSFIDG
jgi:hypothetical protein